MYKKVLGLFVILTISGCQTQDKIPLSPLPGLEIPVSDLFVDISAFPKGWEVEFTDPPGKEDDPKVGTVFREWVGPGALPVWQNIVRGSSVTNAEKLYRKMREGQYSPKATLPPDMVFIEFSPPDQVLFTSQTAEEYYFACGVWGFSYCEIVARYRNYFTNVHLPLMSEIESDGGLTYEEIEVILEEIDQQFLEFFEALDQQTREDEMDIKTSLSCLPSVRQRMGDDEGIRYLLIRWFPQPVNMDGVVCPCLLPTSLSRGHDT